MTRSSSRSPLWRFLSAMLLPALVLAACGSSATYAPSTYQPPNQVRATAAPFRPPEEPTAAAATARAYPDATFQDPGVNPYVDPVNDALSTFALDVDTASWGVARRFIADGSLPDPASVRVEEYVNAFPSGYQPPTYATFAIHVDGAPSPYLSSRSVLVRIGLQSRAVSDEARRPVSLTLVIDTSGSMGWDDRLETVKDALRVLVHNLHPTDTVGIVRFSTDASVVLEPTSAADSATILRAIDRLAPQETTNAQAGLELGFDMAERGHRELANDRVVLASDGVANEGLTDPDSILKRIDREVADGIDLVTVGVGMGNYNDALLEQLADRGNGFYSYVNDRDDAQKLFGEEITGALETVARDARVQVEFDPSTVARYRLLGYENRAMADGQFRNMAADAGEVGAGMTVTALYEVEPVGADGGHLATVRLRWLDGDTRAEEHFAQDVDMGDLSSSFERADPHFRLAATVAAFAEILRESPYVTRTDLGNVADRAEALRAELRNDPDVAQFADAARGAAQISRND